MPLSYATDIRPMFREMPDVASMKEFGLDLSSHEQVKENAARIYMVLEDGSMPCDGPWPMNKVAQFKQWMDEGMAP